MAIWVWARLIHLMHIIPPTDPRYYFPVACQASGGFSTYSDSRLKENVEPVTGALDKVAIMNGVTFTWDNSEKAYEDLKVNSLVF